ncbi:M56 family metallopeptidase [uncultured Flavonifractor sp.]|uniref:M56 family metallopeptidase n=1 Tax=uncultured Flavonifractor sp. TaxID=1193534 RepID=UPI0026110E0A|nr:M56 family metallopeptidase [uncultured Flavonifractor sp.]
MEELFLTVVNLSLTAGWLVLAVLALRLLLRKAPRWSFCLLWGLVALRLMFPFSLESSFSLIPSAQPLPREILSTATPQIQSGIPAVNSAVNPILQEALAPAAGASVNPTQVWSFLLSRIWLAGIAGLLLYALVSTLLLKRRLATATLLEDNIRQSEQVGSPFVLGLFRPVIYLPYHIPEQDLTYVLTHERTHIRRLDHWWKLLGYVLLSIYWFNPLMWVAYVLFCRDLEGACDEKAIRTLDQQARKGYSTALLNCSIHRRPAAPCPLAFGEAGVKSRVKAVMHYRKPAFWIVVIALIACAIAALCFLTSPKAPTVYDVLTQDGYEVLGQEQIDLTLTVPKSALTDDCYTGEGHTFADGQVVVWQDDVTTIYLHNVMPSNESDELLYMTFDCSYHFSNYGSFVTPLQATEDSSVSPQILLRSKILKDGTTTYPDALDLRGYEPGAKFTFYVSKEACMAAQDTLMINIMCNQVQYAKEGYKTSGGQFSPAGLYLYEGDGFGGDFTITLRTDGSFTYYEGGLSSYIGAGKWSVSGDILTLEDETGVPKVNRFRMEGNDLIFQANGSTNFIYVKVADGAVFSKNSEVSDPFPSALSAEVHGTIFLYDSTEYDLSQRNSAINAITNQYQIGDYLIFEGHTGPQNGVYCIFNTVTQTFEPDIQGANLTWYGNDIRSIVYSFWSDVYAYDGTLLASLLLNEGDHINGLRYLDDPTQLEVQIMTASGDSYTELIQLTNAQ